MTERPTKLVHNFDTGITEIIELTDEEIAELEAARLQAEEERAAQQVIADAAAEAKASAEAKLAAIGLTAEEIAALKA
jgi:hypothetical protein